MPYGVILKKSFFPLSLFVLQLIYCDWMKRVRFPRTSNFFHINYTMARDSINRPQEDSSPEEKAGILGRTFFWWIIPILRNGNRNILVAEDLPSTDAKLASNVLRRRILLAWDQRGLSLSIIFCLFWWCDCG